MLSIILLVLAFPLSSQDLLITKAPDSYPPKLLEESQQPLFGEKNYDLALKEVNRVINTLDTSKNLRTYIAALELKFHSYRRQEGVGYEGAFSLIDGLRPSKKAFRIK